jgi:hypothetical protein
VWSLPDERGQYERLQEGLRLYLRLVVAMGMLPYGTTKLLHLRYSRAGDTLVLEGTLGGARLRPRPASRRYRQDAPLRSRLSLGERGRLQLLGRAQLISNLGFDAVLG